MSPAAFTSTGLTHGGNNTIQSVVLPSACPGPTTKPRPRRQGRHPRSPDAPPRTLTPSLARPHATSPLGPDPARSLATLPRQEPGPRDFRQRSAGGRRLGRRRRHSAAVTRTRRRRRRKRRRAKVRRRDRGRGRREPRRRRARGSGGGSPRCCGRGRAGRRRRRRPTCGRRPLAQPAPVRKQKAAAGLSAARRMSASQAGKGPTSLPRTDPTGASGASDCRPSCGTRRDR